ncbi:MAG: hypothetical protein ACI31I_04545 [Bacilli bacterium]
MKKEKKVMTEFDKDHLYGRVFLGAAIILILLVPIIMCLVLNVFPEWSILGKGLVGCIMFIVGGFIEVMTYSPMLGKKGTYLAFFTGNLVNLKLPCAVNAREQANVKHGSKEGEIVSTISIATSTIVTTLVLALGVLCMIPLTPVLQSEVLRPGFDSAFAALFGALAYKYFIKAPKIALPPLVISLILPSTIGFFNDTTILMLFSIIITMIYAFALFRLRDKKEKKALAIEKENQAQEDTTNKEE